MAAFGLFRGKQLARRTRAAVTRHNVYLKLTPFLFGSEQTLRYGVPPKPAGAAQLVVFAAALTGLVAFS